MLSHEDPITKIQSDVKKLRIMVATAFMLIVAGVVYIFFSGERHPQVIARGFYLVDDSGKISAELVNAASGPLLRLSYHDINASITLGSVDEELMLVIQKDEDPRLMLGMAKEGRGWMSLSGGEEVRRELMMGMDNNNNPYILGTGSSKDSKLYLGFKNKEPRLMLLDANKNSTFTPATKDARD